MPKFAIFLVNLFRVVSISIGFLLAPPSFASGLLCADLLKAKSPPDEFVLPIPDKEGFSKSLFSKHDRLVAENRAEKAFEIILKVAGGHHRNFDENPQILSDIHFAELFRRDASVLRSMFYSLAKRTSQQKKFVKFVRDFGILKDILVKLKEDFGKEWDKEQDDERLSPEDRLSLEAKAQAKADSILSEYSDIVFGDLIDKFNASSPAELEAFFKFRAEKVKEIMDKIEIDPTQPKSTEISNFLTIDDVHTVRKNLRDILRFMQISKLIAKSNEEEVSPSLSKQIKYLDKIDSELGPICDEHAGAKSLGRADGHDSTTLSPDHRDRISHFLRNFRLEVGKKE